MTEGLLSTDVPTVRHKRSTGTYSFFESSLTDTPWRIADVPRVATRVFIGGIGVLISWVGASGTVEWHTQLVWIVAGTAAVFFGISGAWLWVLSGFGAVRHERMKVRELIMDRHHRFAAPAANASDLATRFVGDKMHHFHAAGCQLVQGKTVRPIDVESCAKSRLKPCEMCLG